MNLLPKLREAIISAWQGVLDYDRKIPAWKREETRVKREAAKEARLVHDRQMEAQAAAVMEARNWRERIEVKPIPARLNEVDAKERISMLRGTVIDFWSEFLKRPTKDQVKRCVEELDAKGKPWEDDMAIPLFDLLLDRYPSLRR